MTTSISLSGIPWKLQQSQHWKSVLALEYSRKSWFSSLFFLFVHHHLILFFGSIVPSTILSFERKITKVHNLMQIQIWGQVVSSLYLGTKKWRRKGGQDLNPVSTHFFSDDPSLPWTSQCDYKNFWFSFFACPPSSPPLSPLWSRCTGHPLHSQASLVSWSSKSLQTVWL